MHVNHISCRSSLIEKPSTRNPATSSNIINSMMLILDHETIKNVYPLFCFQYIYTLVEGLLIMKVERVLCHKLWSNGRNIKEYIFLLSTIKGCTYSKIIQPLFPVFSGIFVGFKPYRKSSIISHKTKLMRGMGLFLI